MGLRNLNKANDVTQEQFNQFFAIQNLNTFENLYLLSSNDDPKQELFNSLKNDLKKANKLVFIASDPNDNIKMDKYVKELIKYFKKLDIKEFEKIDNRITKFVAIKHIQNTDVIFLMGGDPIKQLEYLKELEFNTLISDFKGTIIGVSAGAMNLATNAFCSKEKEDGESWLYKGLGIVNVTVDPHFDINNKIQTEEFVNTKLEIIGLPDGSFIKIDKYGTKNIYGTYYIKEKNKIMSKID